MQKEPTHIVFFDGVCNFCNALVNFILKHNKKRNLYFSHLESPQAQKLLQQAPEHIRKSDSIIFLENGLWYYKSTAALKIAAHLKQPWKSIHLLIFVPRIMRDATYNLIARNRYQWFGKKHQCRIPSSEEKKQFSENFF